MSTHNLRSARSAGSLFSLAEKQVIALYDSGVLSPAVLNHVLAAYAQSDVDWNAKSALKTVDGHTMQEAVVLVMMPGRALRSAQKDFIAVVDHLAGSSVSEVEENKENEEDDDALLSQLGGGKRRSNGSTHAKDKEAQSAKQPAGFNPLVGARAVPKR